MFHGWQKWKRQGGKRRWRVQLKTGSKRIKDEGSLWQGGRCFELNVGVCRLSVNGPALDSSFLTTARYPTTLQCLLNCWKDGLRKLPIYPAPYPQHVFHLKSSSPGWLLCLPFTGEPPLNSSKMQKRHVAIQLQPPTATTICKCCGALSSGLLYQLNIVWYARTRDFFSERQTRSARFRYQKAQLARTIHQRNTVTFRDLILDRRSSPQS